MNIATEYIRAMYLTERKRKSLRDVGKSGTLSLPNIALPDMNVPEIQVSIILGLPLVYSAC